MKKPIYAISLMVAAAALAAMNAYVTADAAPQLSVSEAMSPQVKWSPYEPLQTPAIPNVKQRQWVRTPIDAFILAQLEAKNLTPSHDADRRTFIRRATLDAWGLLPSPQEVQAFVNDRSPQAYEKLVDRLLASPHYGERQARRWLDLARYADSSGFQNDNTRPNNWRYRDYVIQSFNENKPYDRFVQEQIAGDEMWPNDQQAKIATGFLAGYPDNANSRDLIGRKYEIATDMTDQVGSVFLAQTVGCARCHNHKFDKISEKEYFQLQAYFANTSFDAKVPLIKGTETPWDQEYSKEQAAYNEATKAIRDRQRAILDSVRDQALKYHKERYLTDSRESIFKAQREWNALDRWVNFRLQAVTTEQDIASYLKETSDPAHDNYNPANAQKWKEYEQLDKQLKQFDHLKPIKGSRYLTAATELGHADAPPTFLLFKGILARPQEEVQPGLPALWTQTTGQPSIKPLPDSSGRRSALANWLTNSGNPLTPRVYVNRVWAQYFDKGIVATLGDFGRAGQKPTHPELLDYLASEFVQSGWDVKKLHREIMLSHVYREASSERSDVAKIDPQNKLLAVFPRKRLDAEEVRDTLLQASGLLVDKLGGPSVYPPVEVSSAKDGTPQDFYGNRAWPVSAQPTEDWYRRSIYTFIRRSYPYPVTQNFDPADPSKPHEERVVTTTPLQALTLFNSDVAYQWSQALSARVIHEGHGNVTAELDRLYQILFARSPTPGELATLKGFLNDDSKVIREKLTDAQFAVAVPKGLTAEDAARLDPVATAALVDLVHTVANSNEFLYRF